MAVTSFDSSFSPELFNKALLILSLCELSPILHRGAPLASSVPFLNAHIEFFSLSSLPPLLTDDRQETALNLSTNGISSINMSIEINGVVYTGK